MSDRSYSMDSGSMQGPYGNIMLTAIIILFFVVALMVCLHVYARWYLLRSRTRRHEPPRRRTRLVFYVDNNHPSAAGDAPSAGLDAAVLKSLPLFVFSGETHPEPLECAVCLSAFEENETGRTLPKCDHSFHISCIDMWFQSHSTCPLCRSAVESAAEQDRSTDFDLIPNSVGSGSSCGGGSKPAEIQIPIRSQSLGISEEQSPAMRSPMSRMVSFRRMLSRDKRVTESPSSGCGGDTELDVECGKEATRRAS